MSRRGGWLAAIPLASAVAVAACGVPTGGSFSAIEDADIPYGLGEPTTTTVPSSTTSTAVAPPTSVVASSTIPTEPVTVYFLAGTQLVSIELALVRPASLPQVIAALQEGPPQGPSTAGLRTALRSDGTNAVTDTAGVATVDLAPNLFEDLPPLEQRLAIAQIVLTLTRQRGIGQVRFTQNGQPISIPLGSGEFTEPGAPVTHDDYEVLLGEAPAPEPATSVASP